MIFFLSDLHFCHDKEFLYAPRGYDNIGDMNKDLIEKWNTTVSDEDIVYLLGDIILNDDDAGMRCLRQLKGNIHIILGNHDTANRQKLYSEFYDIKYADMLRQGKWSYYLSHYPTIMGDFKDQKRLWNISGHIHSKDKFVNIQNKVYNVSVDAQNGFPVSLDQIREDIKEQRSLCV